MSRELIRALQEKRIAGAALDVLLERALPGGPPRLAAPLGCRKNSANSTMSYWRPHNGNATWDVRGRRTASIARNMVAMMRGERPATILNPEIYA